MPLKPPLQICAWLAAVPARSACLRRLRSGPIIQPIRQLPPRRALATTSTRYPDVSDPPPRWSRTPPAMVAPVSLKRHLPENRYDCNEDTEVLDEFYRRFLGEDGDKLLSEEVKWLAVTHKSFDQGRRGYNERLGFLGRRIVNLQLSLALLNQPERKGAQQAPADVYGRQPFQHPSTDRLHLLTPWMRSNAAYRDKIADLALRLGAMRVVRWKPRQASDLVASGSQTVLAQALRSIIGAVALQRGGELATRLARDKILGRLGMMV